MRCTAIWPRDREAICLCGQVGHIGAEYRVKTVSTAKSHNDQFWTQRKRYLTASGPIVTRSLAHPGIQRPEGQGDAIVLGSGRA